MVQRVAFKEIINTEAFIYVQLLNMANFYEHTAFYRSQKLATSLAFLSKKVSTVSSCAIISALPSIPN